MWDKRSDKLVLVLNVAHIELDSIHQHLKPLIEVPNYFIRELLDLFQLGNVLSLRLWLLEFFK